MMTSLAVFGFEGLHRWNAAAISGECYLASPHRHVFRCTVEVVVRHDDRDVEFISFARRLRAEYVAANGGAEPVDLGTRSCEQIARELVALAEKDCGRRVLRVEVLEDGENGSRLTVGSE